MIRYVSVMDEVIADAATPEDAIAGMKSAYPAQGGEFLLSLMDKYWSK